MEPISAGLIVAALIAKALDRAEDGVLDGAVEVARRALASLRRHFTGDEEAEEAIDRLEDVPDSERREKVLAELLGARAEDSTELLGELVSIIGEAKGAGVQIGPITQSAEGDGNVQVVTFGGEVSVDRGTASRPRE